MAVKTKKQNQTPATWADRMAPSLELEDNLESIVCMRNTLELCAAALEAEQQCNTAMVAANPLLRLTRDLDDVESYLTKLAKLAGIKTRRELEDAEEAAA